MTALILMELLEIRRLRDRDLRLRGEGEQNTGEVTYAANYLMRSPLRVKQQVNCLEGKRTSVTGNSLFFDFVLDRCKDDLWNFVRVARDCSFGRRSLFLNKTCFDPC